MKRSWTRLLAGAALLSACNAVLGIEDAELLKDGGPDGGGSSGVGGSGATGGAAGDGGSGGSGGSSGSSGSSGSAGSSTGGAAGSAGGGAGGGTGGSTDGGGGSSGADAGCVDVMTDQKNCGWCGHDCGVAPCVQGFCKPEEISGLPWASDFALSADSVFVSGGFDEAFYKMNKNGGGLSSYATADEVWNMALHGSFVYFAEYDTYKVFRASTTGSLAPVQHFIANGPLMGLHVDESGIYYAEYGAGTLRRAKLDGTGSIDFITDLHNVWYMASDATHLYIGAVNDGIYRVAKNATPPIDGNTLAYFHDIPGDGPAALTIDAAHVYFSTGDPSGTFPVTSTAIVRIPKDQVGQSNIGSSTTLVYDIALEGSHAYWVEEGTLQQDFSDGAVRSIDVGNASAALRTYAENQRHPIAIAVDGDWLYWLNGGWTSLPGSVVRVKR